jgi:predicted nucleic acid-binding protein
VIVADSSIWIDFFRGVQTPRITLFKSLLQEQSVFVGDLIQFEVLRGFHSSKQVANALYVFDPYPQGSISSVKIALYAAEYYRHLRTKGITVRKSVDLLVGAFCIEQGWPLLHNDRDFDPMEKYLGLQVIR